MKLSKTLLQTIAIAVTATTFSACTKQKNLVTPTDDSSKDSPKKETPPTNTWDNCPACGLG